MSEEDISFEGAAGRIVEQNLALLFPGTDSRAVDIQVKRPRTRLLRSPSRYSARVIVARRNASGQGDAIHLWVKKTPEAERTFEEMLNVRSRLSERGCDNRVPEALCFDAASRLIVVREFPGRPLTLHTLPRITALSCSRVPASLYRLYRDIGSWLAEYHTAMALSEQIALQDLLHDLEETLDTDSHFNTEEKARLVHHLAAIRADPTLRDEQLPLTRPHNDFCLRNILTDSVNQFAVVDWDAMVHPEFSPRAPAWNDITAFTLNVESLLRFSPLVSAGAIEALADSFLNGYFSGPAGTRSGVGAKLWFFSLYYYIGLIGDRPLHRIYTGWPAVRFARRLRARLLQGPEAMETRFDNSRADG